MTIEVLRWVTGDGIRCNPVASNGLTDHSRDCNDEGVDAEKPLVS